MELMQYAFMQRALLAGALLAVAGGYLGVFVVQRRLAFLTDGLAHAAFGGVAAGLLFGAPPLLFALPATLAVSMGVVSLGRKARLANDTAIGVFFATSVALGIVLLSRKQGSTGDAMAYLFGSIVLIGWAELQLAIVLFLAVLCLVPFWGRWALEGCDPELARTDGLRPERTDYVLAATLSLLVVSAVKLVGAVLAMAFLILPASTARLWSRTLWSQTIASAVLAVASVGLGLWASYGFDLPSGPAIVLAQAALFFASLLLSGARRLRAGNRVASGDGAVGTADPRAGSLRSRNHQTERDHGCADAGVGLQPLVEQCPAEPSRHRRLNEAGEHHQRHRRALHQHIPHPKGENAGNRSEVQERGRLCPTRSRSCTQDRVLQEQGER